MKSFLQAICMSQYYFQLYVYGIIVDLWHYNSLCILAPAPAPLVTWQMAENLRTSYQHRVRLDSPHTGNRVPSLQRVFSVSEWSYQKTSVESYFDLWLSSVISIRADWHHGNCVGGRRLARVTFSLKVLRISNYREWIWACLIPRPSLELSWLHMNSSNVSMQSTKWSVRWPGDEVSSASLFFLWADGKNTSGPRAHFYVLLVGHNDQLPVPRMKSLTQLMTLTCCLCSLHSLCWTVMTESISRARENLLGTHWEVSSRKYIRVLCLSTRRLDHTQLLVNRELQKLKA